VSDHAVFLLVLGACCCGALLAVGLAEYAVWKAEQEEGRFR
jgi:hypothetical protein